jgi:hypothetical protein
MAGRTSKGLHIKFGTQAEHAKLFLGLAAAGLIALGMSGAARAGDVYVQTIHVSAAGLDVRTLPAGRAQAHCENGHGRRPCARRDGPHDRPYPGVYLRHAAGAPLAEDALSGLDEIFAKLLIQNS